MTYWRLHYHIIWSTSERLPTIKVEREKMFYGVLYNKAKSLNLKIHAAGNTADHVHIVLSIPPKVCVADCVRHLKGSSAFAINHMEGSDGYFKWQEGYGALTINEWSLSSVMAHAAQQKEHHKDNNIIIVYERIEDDA